MRILYLSVHAILEYDEVSILHELGHDVFSLGSYVNPTHPADAIRPPIDMKVDENLLSHAPDRANIPVEFLKNFDVVIVMHGDANECNWIEANWGRFKEAGVRVIWRTIGQSTESLEQKMWKYRTNGLEVVRYSKFEANIPNNVGCDKIIHFYKDPEEFKGWVGMTNEVITVAQNMEHRAEHCNFDAFKKLVTGFNAKVYGPSNERSAELNGGYLTYDDMKQKMRDARVFVYTGTQPACYTLGFIEALMTGIPIVALGPKFGNSLKVYGNLYEIQEYIQNGVNGFISDNLEELRGRIETLLNDRSIAERIGKMGRETAIKHFGKDMIKSKWQDYLNKKHE